MTQPWIVANWKMNGTGAQVFEAAETWQTTPTSANVVFCPPIALAHQVKISDSHFYLGGQTCHASASGAYTGHTSARMLKELGCTHVLVGHSEQRPCNVKGALMMAQEQGLIPIWCVGHRTSTPSTFDYIEECEHLSHTIMLERPDYLNHYMVAYEPLSAIGTGKPMNVDAANIIIQNIKKTCPVPVLYGGSVNAANIQDFLKISDGVLIGGMSLDIQEMKNILKTI